MAEVKEQGPLRPRGVAPLQVSAHVPPPLSQVCLIVRRALAAHPHRSCEPARAVGARGKLASEPPARDAAAVLRAGRSTSLRGRLRRVAASQRRAARPMRSDSESRRDANRVLGARGKALVVPRAGRAARPGAWRSFDVLGRAPPPRPSPLRPGAVRCTRLRSVDRPQRAHASPLTQLLRTRLSRAELNSIDDVVRAWPWTAADARLLLAPSLFPRSLLRLPLLLQLRPTHPHSFHPAAMKTSLTALSLATVLSSTLHTALAGATVNPNQLPHTSENGQFGCVAVPSSLSRRAAVDEESDGRLGQQAGSRRALGVLAALPRDERAQGACSMERSSWAMTAYPARRADSSSSPPRRRAAAKLGSRNGFPAPWNAS